MMQRAPLTKSAESTDEHENNERYRKNTTEGERQRRDWPVNEEFRKGDPGAVGVLHCSELPVPYMQAPVGNCWHHK